MIGASVLQLIVIVKFEQRLQRQMRDARVTIFLCGIHIQPASSTRMSAVANRSRVSIRVTKILARQGAWSTSVCNVLQNLVAVSYTECAHVGNPKELQGRWGPAPLC